MQTNKKFSVASMAYNFEYITFDQPCDLDTTPFLRAHADIDGIGTDGGGPDGVTDIEADAVIEQD